MVEGRSSPFAVRDGAVRVALKVTPKAARPGVSGIETGAGGEAVLAVRVGAAPEGGKANAELVRLLAKRWGLAPRDLQVVTGAASRRKVVEIGGRPDDLLERLFAIEAGDRR